MRTRAFVLVTALVVGLAPGAAAVHFYRGPGGGCAPNQGEIGDAGADAAASVMMLHNSFNDGETGLPVTVIDAGESVRWTWNSEHCHSVGGGVVDSAFESGFFYPAPEPQTPALAPGLFHYPVPELDAPQLAFTKTFDEPGLYTYSCVHHEAIGMVGAVIVQ